MNIIIDCREHKLLEEINKLKSKFNEFSTIPIITQSLDIGDIIFRCGEEDLFIIERKNIADLIASIKDGRYEEQSLRLGSCLIHKHNISYLIEGSMVLDHTINKLLFSSLFSILYYKGFSVIRTFTLQETAFFILQTFCKLSKNPSKKSYYSLNDTDRENHSNKSYGEVIKKTKKDNISMENIGAIMLSQIPNVSYNIGKIIMDKYQTIPTLCRAIQENKECLKDMSYIDTKGKSRKVSKTSIQTIVEYLDK